jgi:hypothetical protein
LELREIAPKLNNVDSFVRSLPPNHQHTQQMTYQPTELVSKNLAPIKHDIVAKLKADLEKVFLWIENHFLSIGEK